MTHLETVRAAIALLEAQRDAAPGGKGAWSWEESGAIWAQDSIQILVVDYIDPDVAALVMTLHRTIEAQLVILRDGERTLVDIAGIGMGGVLGHARGAFFLARAILSGVRS